MATRKSAAKTAGGTSTRKSATDARQAQFKRMGQSSSQIVRDAAMLLDDEIAAGIVAAKQMQKRFRKERRIDPGDFKGALQRFQGDAHAVVNMINDQLSQLRSEENAELTTRLTHNTHDLLDLGIELINMGAEIADELAQSNLPKKRGAGHAQRRR